MRCFVVRHFVNTAGEEVITFGLRGPDLTLVPFERWTMDEIARAYGAVEAIFGCRLTRDPDIQGTPAKPAVATLVFVRAEAANA